MSKLNYGPELIKWLHGLGHFDNPDMPTGVMESELSSLTLTSTEVKTALRSLQSYMKPTLDKISQEVHGRDGDADGDLGPATIQLVNTPRCGFPDYPVAGGYLENREEANWPTACRGKLKFGLAFDKAPGMSSEGTFNAFVGAVNNWNYALSDLTATVQRGKSGADIWAGLGRLSGSTLAWSYLARNTCNTTLEQRYDSGRNWVLNYLSTVATHEIGHALGLPHNNDGSALMYPSIHSRSLARRGYPNQTDLKVARGLGYTLSGSEPPTLANQYRPMPHTPEVPDPPETPTGTAVFRGGFELVFLTDEGEQSFGEFILTPKPEV